MPEDTTLTTDNNQPTQTTTPASSDAGQSTQTITEAPSQSQATLPEKFQGKSAEDIAKSYSDLEKKIGEKDATVAQLKEYKKEMDEVLRVLYSDQTLYKSVEDKLLESRGMRTTTNQDEKGDGEGRDQKPQPQSDVRIAEQNRQITDFEGKYKLTTLPKEKRVELNRKIAIELAELVDPSGKKSYQEVINSIPVHQLGKWLEKAFVLSKADVLLNSGSDDYDIASIGSLSASSSKAGSSLGLSEGELQTAQKLGVTPEKYAEQKKQIR